MTGLISHALERRKSVAVKVGHVTVGGDAPIVVQSMTNTDTADAHATALQIEDLHRAGSEIVRITVDREEAAKAVPHIKEKLMARGVDVPIVGDFHYIGHKLLADHPACAEALAGIGGLTVITNSLRIARVFGVSLDDVFQWDETAES